MKNRRSRGGDDFRHFKNKIFFRTLLMAACAVMAVFFMYSLVAGRFSVCLVALIQGLCRMDYNEALDFYQRVVRDRMDLIFIAAMLALFFVVFRIYLNWFTHYFMEINRGIDLLLREGGGEISLPPELSAIEKKMNRIKHTLEKRELDTRLAEQKKNDLIVYLAHDLKTPLASVIAYLNLLRDEGRISDELREKYLSVSLAKAERLEDLINEFFQIAKYNLSTISLEYKKINLTRLLEQILYEFQPQMDEKNVICKLHAPEEICLSCDADKMQRVFDNLLRNAVIYCYENSEIDVSVSLRENRAEIRVVNQGGTIPEEKLERIFEQFYRLDASRSTGSGEAGLGLAIAKKIVELHGGVIWAESENERVEFVVTMPLLPPPTVGKS